VALIRHDREMETCKREQLYEEPRRVEPPNPFRAESAKRTDPRPSRHVELLRVQPKCSYKVLTNFVFVNELRYQIQRPAQGKNGATSRQSEAKEEEEKSLLNQMVSLKQILWDGDTTIAYPPGAASSRGFR
jgi:hypothetical protein